MVGRTEHTIFVIAALEGERLDLVLVRVLCCDGWRLASAGGGRRAGESSRL